MEKITIGNRVYEGLPKSRGLTLLQKHVDGGRLTARKAVIAKCCACVGFYVDGRTDCEMPSCPLYPWMPYRADRKKKP